MEDHIKKAIMLASKFLGIDKEIEVYCASKEEFPTPDTASVFLNEACCIVFNEEWLDTVEFVEAIITCYHEIRHVYQWLQVTGQMEIKEDPETLKNWKAEFENYYSPDDEAFLHRDIEIDALAFAHFLGALILDVKTVIPKVIRGKGIFFYIKINL